MKFCGSNQASLTGQSTMDNGQKKDMRQRTRNWTFLQQRKKLFKWNVALKTTADWSFGSSLEDFPGIYTAKKKIDYVSHKNVVVGAALPFPFSWEEVAAQFPRAWDLPSLVLDRPAGSWHTSSSSTWLWSPCRWRLKWELMLNLLDKVMVRFENIGDLLQGRPILSKDYNGKSQDTRPLTASKLVL